MDAIWLTLKRILQSHQNMKHGTARPFSDSKLASWEESQAKEKAECIDCRALTWAINARKSVYSHHGL